MRCLGHVSPEAMTIEPFNGSEWKQHRQRSKSTLRWTASRGIVHDRDASPDRTAVRDRGVPDGAVAGYFMITEFSSNMHDRSVEASMTSIFFLGPVGTVIQFIVGFICSRRPTSTAPCYRAEHIPVLGNLVRGQRRKP